MYNWYYRIIYWLSNGVNSVLVIICLLLFVNCAISQRAAVIASGDARPTTDTVKKGVPTVKYYYKSPGLAMLLSAIIPGGGQFYTTNYLKGILFVGTEVTLSYFAIKDHLDYQETNNLAIKNRRNNLLWWIATVKLLSVADAYVSANMYKFKDMMKLTVDYDIDQHQFILGVKTKI